MTTVTKIKAAYKAAMAAACYLTGHDRDMAWRTKEAAYEAAGWRAHIAKLRERAMANPQWAP